MTTPQPTEYGTAKTLVVCPGNGTRYFIVYGPDFVALPDFKVAATMSPWPLEWHYIAVKLGLNETDAKAVLVALQQAQQGPPIDYDAEIAKKLDSLTDEPYDPHGGQKHRYYEEN